MSSAFHAALPRRLPHHLLDGPLHDPGPGDPQRRPLASLRLVADPAKCGDCQTCVVHCPMSLDVNALVHAGSMEHRERILCGTCVDGCPKHAIRYCLSAF